MKIIERFSQLNISYITIGKAAACILMMLLHYIIRKAYPVQIIIIIFVIKAGLFPVKAKLILFSVYSPKYSFNILLLQDEEDEDEIIKDKKRRKKKKKVKKEEEEEDEDIMAGISPYREMNFAIVLADINLKLGLNNPRFT